MDFKVGDIVLRVGCSFNRTKKGEVYEVTGILDSRHISISEIKKKETFLKPNGEYMGYSKRFLKKLKDNKLTRKLYKY